MKSSKIYLDNAATTPVDERVLKAMMPYFKQNFANPSSIHSLGVAVKNTIIEARKNIANFFNARAKEIIFTSGGTEANNLAVFGTYAELTRNYAENKNEKLKSHFITTEIEHSSILEVFKKLEKDGHEVSYLKVDENGLVNPKDLRKLIKENTILISVGYVNGEIGVIEPIKEIAKEIRHKRKEFNRGRIDYPYFHTDASQAVEYLNMNVEELGADLITIDGQKIYGPKGIGALYVKTGVKISPQILGGGQENGMRSGTENVPLIVGFVKALEIVSSIKEKESKRLSKLRDEFFVRLKRDKKFVPGIIINGDLKNRLPNNINISIPNKDGEEMVLRLDEEGIICSSASACASGSGESEVVRKLAEASGISKEKVDDRAKSVLRFSLGRSTKKEDINKLIKALHKVLSI